MATTTALRYSLDDCRTVLGWYATDDARLVHAAGVPERRDVLERLGWVVVTRVLRMLSDGSWRRDVAHVEVTRRGRAVMRPHPYDPRRDLGPSPVFVGYDPCSVCADVLRVPVHAAT